MNLYLVSQQENIDYDTYDSFVVACPDEDTARYTSPSEFYVWGGDGWYFEYENGESKNEGRSLSSWTDPDNVSVELIGVAANGVQGIVCSSFNAG